MKSRSSRSSVTRISSEATPASDVPGTPSVLGVSSGVVSFVGAVGKLSGALKRAGISGDPPNNELTGAGTEGGGGSFTR